MGYPEPAERFTTFNSLSDSHTIGTTAWEDDFDIFQFPIGFSLAIEMMDDKTWNEITFNSLSDSHRTRRDGIYSERNKHFQFPIGFSQARLYMPKMWPLFPLSIPYRILT